jgi:hypothetical protein
MIPNKVLKLVTLKQIYGYFRAGLGNAEVFAKVIGTGLIVREQGHA